MMPNLTQLQIAGILALAAVVSFGGWLLTHDAKVVRKEQARVEAKGAKVDARAQQKRANAAANPDQALLKYWRD